MAQLQLCQNLVLQGALPVVNLGGSAAGCVCHVPHLRAGVRGDPILAVHGISGGHPCVDGHLPEAHGPV